MFLLQLNLYVSAQAALYVLGLADPNQAASGLRHYVRALSMCYNFRAVNSNQVCSDKAYPMMRLLKLMFPKGKNFVWKPNFDIRLN